MLSDADLCSSLNLWIVLVVAIWLCKEKQEFKWRKDLSLGRGMNCYPMHSG